MWFRITAILLVLASSVDAAPMNNIALQRVVAPTTPTFNRMPSATGGPKKKCQKRQPVVFPSGQSGTQLAQAPPKGAQPIVKGAQQPVVKGPQPVTKDTKPAVLPPTKGPVVRPEPASVQRAQQGGANSGANGKGSKPVVPQHVQAQRAVAPSSTPCTKGTQPTVKKAVPLPSIKKPVVMQGKPVIQPTPCTTGQKVVVSAIPSPSKVADPYVAPKPSDISSSSTSRSISDAYAKPSSSSASDAYAKPSSSSASDAYAKPSSSSASTHFSASLATSTTATPQPTLSTYTSDYAKIPGVIVIGTTLSETSCSLDICAKTCIEKADTCVGFNYDSASTKCILKSTITDSSSDSYGQSSFYARISNGKTGDLSNGYTTKTYSVIKNVFFATGKISYVAGDVAKCEAECAKSTQCMAFTYKTAESDGTPKGCWMMSKLEVGYATPDWNVHIVKPVSIY